MISETYRYAKRILVLLPGLVIAYLSIRDIFPYFDRRLPLALAILVTYVLGAYVLVPAVIRLIRIIRPAQHLPNYCVTPDGFASDPLNIGIVGNRRRLISAMEASGWSLADSRHPKHLLRYVVSSLFGRPYASAPLSNLYLFGRKQDLGFEKLIDDQVSHRHHVRFWATAYDTKDGLNFKHMQPSPKAAKDVSQDLLWVGAASLDSGLTFIRHNLQISHMILPDTNAERDLIISGLKDQGLIASQDSFRISPPYRLVNRVWRGQLHSDGKMCVAKLKITDR